MTNQQIKRSYMGILIAAFSVVMTVRCASEGGQDSTEEPVSGNGLDQQSDVNASLNSNSTASAQQKNAAAQGESMNNAVGNNFAGANGNPLMNSGTTNAMSNPLSNPSLNAAAVPLNQSAPVNGTVTTNTLPVTNNAAALANAATEPTPPTNAAVAPTNTAGATPAASPTSWDKMNASPFTNKHMNWPGHGKVKYITRKATRHASPNGPVVGEFNVGNHPLIYQNGNWVELSNGTYVKGDATTDQPGGYQRSSRGAAFSH